ncbi:MAG: SRPBCC family protein [Isosphaeraceae bacterium]
MANIAAEVEIEGPIAAVFDLATSARFWREWHPATLAVSGVTERPYQPGDVIFEHARIGPREFRIAWVVEALHRPRSAILRNPDSGARIRHDLEPSPGGVRLRFELAYDEALVGEGQEAIFRDLIGRQSREAVSRLRDVIGRILRDEAITLP